MTNSRSGGITIDIESGVLRFVESIPVPVRTAWTLITARTHIAKWWGSFVSLDLFPGGGFEELWSGTPEHQQQIHALGTVLHVAAPHLLDLSWREETWNFSTEVNIRLRETLEGTEVAVSHGKWPTPVTPEVRRIIARHYYAWRMCLTRLKAYAAAQKK